MGAATSGCFGRPVAPTPVLHAPFTDVYNLMQNVRVSWMIVDVRSAEDHDRGHIDSAFPIDSTACVLRSRKADIAAKVKSHFADIQQQSGTVPFTLL
eukprot:5866839-Amphidinium_carterae.1